MREVELIQKELSELTGLTRRLGSPEEPVAVAPNDSRVVFRLPEIAEVIYPSLLPGATPYWGRTIEIIASYDVPPYPNPTKGKVGETITVWSYEEAITRLQADKTYQGHVKRSWTTAGPGEFWIREILVVAAEEEPELEIVKLTCPRCGSIIQFSLEHIYVPPGMMPEEAIRTCPVCDQYIFRLGWHRVVDMEIIEAPEEDERLRRLEEQIRALEEKLAALRAEIARLQAQAGMRPEDKALLADLQRLIEEERAKVAELEAGVAELEEEVPLWKRRWDAAAAITEAPAPKTHGEMLALPSILIQRIEDYVDAWGEEAIEYWRIIVQIRRGEITLTHREIMRLMTEWPSWKIKATLAEQVRLAEEEYHRLYTELRDAKDDLERAKRRLGDAVAALKRAELEIRRAIALREAEVDAAKARYELELRTLENLKATYSALLKEIELAKREAILEAAQDRLEVLEASEKDRLAIAGEQIRLAEEFKEKAEEAAGVEREEYLDKMRRALEAAKEAQESAVNAAKEREATAKEIAALEAELARIELELEEARGELGVTQEKKEEAERKVAGLPAIPTWGWAALGIAGATLSAVGIGYALKKKKRR